MANHAAARDAWHNGAAAQFAQAQAQHEECQRKITAAEAAAETAEAQFKTEFAAAGYEKTSTVAMAAMLPTTPW